MTTETNHARENAGGWASTIAELVAALECDYDRLEELRDEKQVFLDELGDKDTSEADRVRNENALAVWNMDNGDEFAELITAATLDGEVCKDADAACERIQESPLSVEVRSDWHSPGDPSDNSCGEFRILLSTGGPALQLRGELDPYRQPSRAWLEYQDWGTPWTEYHGEGCEHETLLTFCQQFYFGE